MQLTPFNSYMRRVLVHLKVSVVVFASSVDELFQLDQFQDQTSLLTAIAAISFTSGGSNAADAIQFVYEESFSASKGARPNANKLVVLITDGGYSSSSVEYEAILLKKIAAVLAIGIGSNVQFENVKVVATDDSLAWSMANTADLNSIIEAIDNIDWTEYNDTLQVRLIGGSSPFEGRVEVNVDGIWGTVCDDSFGPTDAIVICRMLGVETSNGVFYSLAHFGPGTGSIFFDDVSSQGDEQSLFYCRYTTNHNCGHHEDVSVLCSVIYDTDVEDTDIISEDEEDEEGLTPVQLFGIITGCLILLILVSISIPIEMKRRAELRKRQDFLRHCDVAPLNATIWNLLVVVDARDAIMMYTEKVINALRCLKPTPTIKRTNIHRLHIETETVSASKTVFFISERYTRPSDCAQLCAKIKLSQDVSGSALFVSLDSSCSNGKIYPLIKNKADIGVSPSTDTVANVNMLFKTLADFYFQCKRNGHCFHVDQTINRNSKSGKLQEQITDHLQSFGFKQTETKTTGDIVIYVIDDVMDLNDVIGVTGSLKSYIFVNVIKVPTMHVLTSSTNIAIFSRDEVVKGVLTILTDSKIIRANMSSKGYTDTIRV